MFDLIDLVLDTIEDLIELAVAPLARRAARARQRRAEVQDGR
ncbi:MAG TPA: hypothetical protein VGS97_19820 [Actinocrinis sp.]|nr:hypothetical protein [Actinocrinis sp.]HEV2346358.1 hypothetical protein [Actinocrinis sp.]